MIADMMFKIMKFTFIYMSLIMAAMITRTEAVVLPMHFANLIPAGHNGMFTLGGANFQQVLTQIAQDTAVWGQAAGSTSHDVRANLIAVITAHVPPPPEDRDVFADGDLCNVGDESPKVDACGDQDHKLAQRASLFHGGGRDVPGIPDVHRQPLVRLGSGGSGRNKRCHHPHWNGGAKLWGHHSHCLLRNRDNEGVVCGAVFEPVSLVPELQNLFAKMQIKCFGRASLQEPRKRTPS